MTSSITPGASRFPSSGKYLLDGRSLNGPRDAEFVDHGNAYTPGSPAPESPSPWDWVETDWDTALDLVADKLVEIYRRDGSDAMAVYGCAKATNEDNYLLQKIYRSLFRTNNIDHCTRLCHAGSVIALQQARRFFGHEQHRLAGHRK